MVAISTSKLLAGLTRLIAQPASLNRLVDCTTNHTGKAAIRNLNLTFDLGDDNVTTTNVTLQNLSFTGLDTFTALRLLQPGGGGSQDEHRGTVFTSLVAMDQLGIEVDLDLGLGPGRDAKSKAGSIIEHMQIKVSRVVAVFSHTRVSGGKEGGKEGGSERVRK